MLMCEATTCTCSVLSLKWQMADHTPNGQDMHMYTVMCAVSTFSASVVTLLLIVVPTQVCTRSELCDLILSARKALLASLDTERECVGAGVDLTGREWPGGHTERHTVVVRRSALSLRYPVQTHTRCRPAGTETPDRGRWRACTGPGILTSNSCGRRL